MRLTDRHQPPCPVNSPSGGDLSWTGPGKCHFEAADCKAAAEGGDPGGQKDDRHGQAPTTAPDYKRGPNGWPASRRQRRTSTTTAAAERTENDNKTNSAATVDETVEEQAEEEEERMIGHRVSRECRGVNRQGSGSGGEGENKERAHTRDSLDTASTLARACRLGTATAAANQRGKSIQRMGRLA